MASPYGMLSPNMFAPRPGIGLLSPAQQAFDPRNLPQGLLLASPDFMLESPDTPAPGAQNAGPAPFPMEGPMPPPRPSNLSDGVQEALQSPAQGMPQPAQQPSQAQGGGFMERADGLLSKLGNIYGQGGSGDALINLGIALASPGDRSTNLARAMQANALSQNQRQAQQLQQARLAQQQQTALDQRAAREQQITTLSETLGIPREQAAGIPDTAASQILADKYKPKQGPAPSLVEVANPDGTRQSQWITPGQSSGVPVGQPVGTPNKIADEAKQREELVRSRGMDPNDPRNRDFIVTGNLPKENQQQLTAADKQAIREADDSVASNSATIANLKRAKELSAQALSGPSAYLAVPGSWVGNEAAMRTREFSNLMTGQALESLKATFGGAPTEGERKILLEVQGAADMPPELRDRVIDRAIQAAERRMAQNKTRADELRGGSYYKPGGGTVSAPAQPPDPLGIR